MLAGAGDYVMPDLMRIGGVSGWLRAAAITGAAGIPMSTHLYPEIAAHLMRVTDSAHWLEWQDWADPILSEPFQVKDGQVLVPDRPGPRHRLGREGRRKIRVVKEEAGCAFRPRRAPLSLSIECPRVRRETPGALLLQHRPQHPRRLLVHLHALGE